MREEQFRTYLETSDKITSKEKAVRTRISRCNAVEEILGESLDSIVSEDKRMYEALVKLNTSPKERNGNLQNALRWYYQFVNDKKFPQISTYEKQNRI